MFLVLQDPKSRFQSLFGDSASSGHSFLQNLGRRTSLSLGLNSDRILSSSDSTLPDQEGKAKIKEDKEEDKEKKR